MDTELECGDSTIRLIKNSSSEIQDNIFNIDDLFKPVETLNLDCDSDYSEISDVFKEFHKDSFLRLNADAEKKHLSKTEADWKTVDQFTEEFKKTMSEVREELNVNRPLFDEEDAIERILSNPPVPHISATSVRDSPITIEPEQDHSETSSQSLVWKRLLNNSDGTFKVSPPVFDAFRQEKKHWLERPPISWKVIDDCRVKCEKWLNRIMQV